MATQNLPRQFGKYVLMRKIAMGGMAEIFKAKTAGAEGFEKDIVIKRILPHFTEDEAFVKMFIDEASITSKLQHANIVQIFDFDLCENTYFIAMEYVEGVDLKKVIDVGVKEGKPLSPAQCAWIMMELSKGLHYAHTKEVKGKPLNIVHRDISPHNAMVSFSGEVKLMDFGIAKAAQRSTKTMAGTVKGKVAYMSPEQARGKSLDGRSDLFALGIMMWEMLTHKRLFLGDSDFETLTNVLKSDPPPPSSINPAVPADLDAIVLKSLHKDRENRHASVEAFNRDLTRWYYSNVTDLEAEALKPYMQVLFAEDIEQLKAFAAEEKGLPRPGGDEAPADSDRTVALPGGYDPQQAATLLDDGSISQQQIRDAIAQKQAGGGTGAAVAPPMGMGTGTYQQQGFTGTYSGQLVPEKKSKTLLWVLLAVLFLGGGGFAAWYFLGQDKKPEGNGSLVDGNGTAPAPVADAELVIMVSPREALVKVNGKPVDGKATGLELGKRARVEAVAPGYKPFEELVMMSEKSQPFEITMEKEAEDVSLLIEAVGDEKAVIKVNGKAGANPFSVKGKKGDSLEVEVIPSAGGEPKKSVVVLDGASPIRKIDVTPPAATEIKLLVGISPANAKVKASVGTVSFSAAGDQAIIGGLKVDDSVTVEVSEAGYETQEKTFKVTGDGQLVSVTLEKKKPGAPGGNATPPASGSGSVSINAKPWAQVHVDGKPVGTTPKTITLSAGKHTIKLTKGSQTETRTVTVKANGTVSVTHDFTN